MGSPRAELHWVDNEFTDCPWKRVPDMVTEGGSPTARPPARAFLLVAKEMSRGALTEAAKGGEKNVGRRGGLGTAGARAVSPGWQAESFSLAGLHAEASSRTADILPLSLPSCWGLSLWWERGESSPWSRAFLPLYPPEERGMGWGKRSSGALWSHAGRGWMLEIPEPAMGAKQGLLGLCEIFPFILLASSKIRLKHTVLHLGRENKEDQARPPCTRDNFSSWLIL